MAIGAHHDEVGGGVKRILYKDFVNATSRTREPVDRHLDTASGQIGCDICTRFFALLGREPRDRPSRR